MKAIYRYIVFMYRYTAAVGVYMAAIYLYSEPIGVYSASVGVYSNLEGEYMPKMHDWLYQNEADFKDLCMVWRDSITNSANQTAYNWPKEECQSVADLTNVYASSLRTYQNVPTTANHHQKEDDKVAAEKAIRSFARAYMRYNPKVPHTLLMQLHLDTPDAPEQPPIEIPEFGPQSVVIADDRAPGVVQVRYEGARPHGSIGCEIVWQTSVEAPVDTASFTNSESEVFTENPWKQTFTGVKAGEKLHYALRWEFTGRRYSPWSKVESASIP